MIAACSSSIYSRQNMKILVVDRNPQPEAGKKTINGWICGDAVGKNSVDYMTRRIGITWRSPEIEHPVKGVVAYSPDHETPIYFDGDGYILNRKLLPQKQLRDATDLGVEFKGSVALRAAYTEDGFVRGVIGTDLTDNSPFKKTAKLVIDCAGVTSVLRQNLPIKSYIQRIINRDDLEATGRYIYEFENGEDNRTFFDPDYAIIHLDQIIAPGGYAWVFPKGKNKVNIGLGVQQKSLELRNRTLGKKEDLRRLIDNYVTMNPVIKKPKIADGWADNGNGWGTWQVSVRRQNDCMVANGYVIAGDAAWMPKPLDAGGIGPAIIAATIVGKVAVQAIESNDISEKGLWRYNVDFMHDYGYKTAGLEVFRRFLQTLKNEQINYGTKHFLSKLDVEKISHGEHPEFGTIDKVGMLIRGALNKKTAEGLKYTADKNQVLVRHYNNYPEIPGDFPTWHSKLMKELNEAFEKFEITPKAYA
ncbi:MAG: NAD(P)/FAD-dependent oxidoreductase [Nitrososphaerales archaeon]